MAETASAAADGLATTPPPGLAYRPVEPGDRPFLARLYASTRRDEVAVLPWTEAEKDEFLAFQFEAQRHHYETHFPDCAFRVIEESGVPIGRLYLDRREEEIRVVDIALLPRHRGRGLGTAILERVLAEGRRTGRPVRIHVERANPARRLYDRLGFRPVDSNGIYTLMEWRGDAA